MPVSCPGGGMSGGGDVRFCPCCGENVDTYLVDREGRKEICCIFCGMIVEDRSGRKFVPAESVLVADDSAMIRSMMRDLLLNRSLTRAVTECSDGSKFITLFTRKAGEGDPFSLVVLDIAMPVLNGINAAIAMRSIERAFGLRPTPILFFTGVKCDDNFKKVLAYCRPALYVNKGVSSTPDLMASRIGEVVIRLLKEVGEAC